jgi:hypothetical protein
VIAEDLLAVETRGRGGVLARLVDELATERAPAATDQRRVGWDEVAPERAAGPGG